MDRTNHKDSCRILIFAKSPEAGEVKTLLIPLLGAEGARVLQERLVRHALATAVEAKVGTVELWCTPSTEHPFFARCAEEFGVALRSQGPGDLGQRMFHAFQKSLCHSERVLLVGSDCPSLTPQDLRQAVEKLKNGNEVLLGPTEDGAYVLIGLSRCSPRLFQGIAWGGSHVMEQTRQRLHKLGWRWFELPVLWDVDRPDDWRRLAHLPGWEELRAAKTS
ncbi:MAG TPA: TIGR04282 family arsenosugar biosynthesis glycosyltransferase [Burkholderiales bacterium]|nr:TIGR04282 family arsenosugar biosynthesis glycosyltransferase [Burkholderiales bacterium]